MDWFGEQPLLYVFFGSFSLILTIFLTPRLIHIFTKKGLLDQPGERKIHTAAVPRGGGITIYAAVIFAIAAHALDLNFITYFILSSFIILICGIWDDIVRLRWKIKFILQAIAAVGLTLFVSSLSTKLILFSVYLPSPLNYILLFFFTLGVLNAFNFLDGLDGLVSGFSLITSVVLLIIGALFNNHLVLLITASLAGSLIGFLKFNFHPAKIFLGDTGALILGFFILISSLDISMVIEPGFIDLTFPVILLSVPIIDTLKVIVFRLYMKRSPFVPDKNHIHHILLNRDLTQKSVMLIINSFTIFYAFTAVCYLAFSKLDAVILYILLTAGFLYTQYFFYNNKKVPLVQHAAAVKRTFAASHLYKLSKEID